MPRGENNLALVAKPPSPEYPDIPFPTMVVIIPEVSTLRILLLAPSTI